jgi:hypothetical protein
MNSSELFQMFRFGISIAFQVPLQILFVAEAAWTMRTF